MMERTHARECAVAFMVAMGGKVRAEAHELDGTWHVVTRDLGDGYDLAFPAHMLTTTELLTEGWTWAKWRRTARVVPEGAWRVAVAYYLATGRELGDPDGGSALDGLDTMAALRIARDLAT
jgi:hypothetical protein